MTATPDQDRIGRDRIIQVFNFLKALHAHRTPTIRQLTDHPWVQWFDEFPDHPCIRIGARRREPEIEPGKGEVPDDDAFILRVERPNLVPPPTPPASLRPWLKRGWEDPENADIHCADSTNEQGPNGKTRFIRFKDSPSLAAALERWKEERDEWRRNELPARRAMHVFERLYELHGRIERESERVDLVIGDGILSWQRDDGSIYHPLLLQRVQLVFDPTIPQFSLVNADSETELCTSLFQQLADVDPRALSSCQKELTQGDYHPLTEEAAAFLKRLAVTLSPQGVFQGPGRPPPESQHPRIGRAPAIFLRARNAGFGVAIEQVLTGLRDKKAFNKALLNVVGVEETPCTGIVDTVPAFVDNDQEPGDILFGKEANPEQIRMARRLDVCGSVLVQGPPGTGKSHTIANLIGHLLANDKRILVTSHTTKALRVLRQHVVTELQPLCVSVLEGDLESRDQLRASVEGISTRLGESDGEALANDAQELSMERRQLRARLATLQNDLLNARSAEYREIVVGGQAMTPSDGARRVAEGLGVHDWIPGPLAPGEPLPLSPGELVELYASNTQTLPEDDGQARIPLPKVDDLLSPDEFEEMLRTSDTLADQAETHDDDLWPGVTFTTHHLQQLEPLISDLKLAVDEFRRLEPWQLAAVDAGRAGVSEQAPWEHLIGKAAEAMAAAADAQLSSMVYEPTVSTDDALEQQRQRVAEIVDYLQAGGRLSGIRLLFQPAWKRAIRSWRVRNTSPKRLEDFVAIQKTLATMIAHDELAILWDGLMARHGAAPAADLGENLEQVCSQYTRLIRDATQWWNRRWSSLIGRLTQMGFSWDRFLGQQPPSLKKHGAMMREIDAVDHRLLQMLTHTVNRLRSLYLKTRVRRSAEHLRAFGRPEAQQLRRALEREDVDVYRYEHERLVAATARQQFALRRHDLLSRLERNSETRSPLAEAWASHIRNRVGVHGQKHVPGDPQRAWEWRQMADELDRRRAVDLEGVNEQIERAREQLADITNRLIDRLAWAGQVRRTTLRQQQNLIGWLETKRRIGGGFSQRDPQLRQEARKLMNDCREAVPVWIMPLARLVESFDFSKTEFDVVIIDEASQCDVMALLAFAIAKQVIVVGDHEQVRPLAVGQVEQVVDNLSQLHLQGIPNHHLYGGKMSVYDLARASFGGMIRLLEHFRCVPDIIQFSNHLSYDGEIKPLRDESSSPFERNVIPYRVEGTRDDGKVNRMEAVTIASLIVAAIESPRYAGQTFGVISLVDEEQAIAIQQLLLRRLTPAVFKERRILCGNSAQFQGDERDVMFLSLVDAPRGAPLPLRQEDRFKQRFNVAASRAKNQMWVVYSLNPQVDLKPGDLRRRLIEHALDPKAVTRELDRVEHRAESEFERLVIKRLIEARYRVTPQWKVGRYRIDMVIEGQMLAGGKRRRLAVECDGDRYHPIEKLSEDMERQAILERLGWTFHRIRGSEFFRDPNPVMERLLSRLASLGIEPIAGESAPVDDGDSQTDAIIRRAAEIRAEWAANEENSADTRVGNGASDGGTSGQRFLFSSE